MVRRKQNDGGGNLEVYVLVVPDLDQAQIRHEMGVATKTGVDWDSFCREVCEVTLFENSMRIGGPGKIVQIDESKFGKRKCCEAEVGVRGNRE